MAGRRRGEMKSGASGSSDAAGRAVAEPSGSTGPSKRDLAAGLYIVATPIGHASDITLRALEILRGVDLIACEDTRVSAKLLAIHEIATRRLAYHDHNAERVRPLLLARLEAGERVALISDAGTPLISDPGYKLVRAAISAGIPVRTVPGASAALAALVVSGLPSDRFLFAGFLDARGSARRRDLGHLAGLDATLVFYESAQRLAASLADMAEILGDRPAAVARELTKFYEEVVRDGLSGLARHYALTGPPKGEIVIVVGPPLDAAPAAEAEIDTLLREALGRASLRDAAAEIAARLDLPRREIYARALLLARETT
jgi:16S rRNA (cytidine1402-2'-O)-methyltransferase